MVTVWIAVLAIAITAKSYFIPKHQAHPHDTKVEANLSIPSKHTL